MADPQLVEWIKTQQAKGFTPEQVRQYLYQMRYPQQAVEEAMGEARQPKRGGSKILIVTAGITILIILIITAFFLFSGEDEYGETREHEETVTETPLAGTTPEELKSEILTSYIHIRNYAFEKSIRIVDRKAGSNEALQKTIINLTDGIVEVKEKKAYTNIITSAEEPGLFNPPSFERYLIDGELYLKTQGIWSRTDDVPEGLFELKEAIALVQDSDVILMEDDGSHIRIIAGNELVGQNIIIPSHRETFMADSVKEMDFGSAVQEADIQCWLDDERIKKLKADVIIAVEKEGVTYEKTISYSIEFSGYNSRQQIILPPEAKDAQETVKADVNMTDDKMEISFNTSLPMNMSNETLDNMDNMTGEENGAGESEENETIPSPESGSNETTDRYGSNYTYEKYQEYDPMNPVTVADKYVSSVINTDPDKYLEILNNEMFEAMKDLPDPAIIHYLEEQKPKFINGYEVSHCRGDDFEEVDCENPGDNDSIKLYMQIEEDGEPTETYIELVLEEDGWKI